MSREERKMAQIIASIERMEQETRASGDDTNRAQEPQDWTRQQGGRGKKGKKGKLMGVKVKSSKKLKVTTGVDGLKTPFERKLTPKKRWIQLWSAQMDNNTENDAGSSSEGVEKEAEEHATMVASAVSTSSGIDVKVVQSVPCNAVTLSVAKKEEEQVMMEEPMDVPTAAPLIPLISEQKTDTAIPVPIPTSMQEQFAEIRKAPVAMTTTTSGDDVVTMTSSTSSESLELRVKTPLNSKSSHLSPPLERNSPTTAASISPSAKVKDSETPNTNTTAVAKFSPAATEQLGPVVATKKTLATKESGTLELASESSSSSSCVDRGDNNYRGEIPEHHSGHGRKRSLELNESPMSEEAKRRAERRRKRKSNWDVGDPRKGGSPVADPPISAAAAAANQQSFAKYPPNRPSWRHSQSMMDMKPHFPSGHRPSSFYNNGPNTGGRRGFYHMSSLPQDRSRSAGRSSSRYSYGTSTSTSSSNYR